MNLKFLPIGTVCLVENVNKKQMIIGYSKSGYDYVAVEYPKGFESDNKLSYFNHGQVQELYSLGYKNEESRIFNGTLISVQTVESDDDSDAAEGITPTSNLTVEEIPVISNPFQFDDNGIVISDSNEEIPFPYFSRRLESESHSPLCVSSSDSAPVKACTSR